VDVDVARTGNSAYIDAVVLECSAICI
jgi:hypothetical protein